MLLLYKPSAVHQWSLEVRNIGPVERCLWVHWAVVCAFRPEHWHSTARAKSRRSGLLRTHSDATRVHDVHNRLLRFRHISHTSRAADRRPSHRWGRTDGCACSSL